jgi:ABC-2 type transport system ATP-binding protein
MISVEGVSKSFGSLAAVRDVTFEVARGEVVGLLGSNGAGKTTTIRMVTGFVPPDAGRIRIDGRDTIDSSRAARSRIGYLAESAPAYAEMSVQDYLAFRARLFGVERRARAGAIDRVVGLCELQEARTRRVGHLSKGFRQRVGLAAAIVHDPAVLVLDEPGNALDPRQIRHTRSLIRELGRDRAVLVSSHVLPEVEQTCDRVIMMARGRVLAQGAPRGLIDRQSGEAAYIVECRKQDDPSGVAIAEVLSKIQGIERLDRADALGEGWYRFALHARSGEREDLRESIAAATTSAGLHLRELRRDAITLERAFMEIIERDAIEEEAR